jgi:methyl-accepting chemotaxis protein
VNGDLTVRGDVTDLDERYGQILSNINQIVEVIIAPVLVILSRLELVADGKLTAYIHEDFAGDHNHLKGALNDTLDSLNTILRQVAQASEQIAIGSGEVSSSAQTLSVGATRQAAAIEEISASISEMADQIRKNAKSANEANILAENTEELARSGDERMK